MPTTAQLIEEAVQELIDLNHQGDDWDREHIKAILSTIATQSVENERKKFANSLRTAIDHAGTSNSPVGVAMDYKYFFTDIFNILKALSQPKEELND